MAAQQAIVVVIVAFLFHAVQAFEAMENLPFSSQTCRLAGIAIISVLLVLLQSKSQDQGTEASETPSNSIASEEAQWWYRDPTGKAHGPFSAVAMLQWYNEGYMTPSLMVKFGDMADFSPLGVLFPGESVPFVSSPQVPGTQTEGPVPEEEKQAWSSDDEEAVIRKWRTRRRVHYKETLCDMAVPVQ